MFCFLMKRLPQGWRSRGVGVCALLLLWLAFPAGGTAETLDDEATLQYLKQLSLEGLLELEVSSVSKKNEKLSDAAAAIFVLTQEDIRRSGMRTLPDLLRLVPGLHVANIDAHTWAISARGFNGLFANKLLVLIDGRSVYTPLYSGVYWDMQDTVLEDIERIEVIRGPGAAIWGANAVNGVINIITKSARETPGGFVSAGSGSADRAEVNARYGVVDDRLAWRIFGKYLKRDDFETQTGGESHDDWDTQRAGFRVDWTPRDSDKMTLEGDLYQGQGEQRMDLNRSDFGFQPFATDVDMSGGDLLARWEKSLDDSSSLMLQAYYDRTLREDGFLKQSRDTWDLDFNHRFSLGQRQDLIWGGGYRFTSDTTEAGYASGMLPEDRNDDLFSLFVQDDIALRPERLHLIFGSKFEHNDFTGFEIQPTVRLLWTPDQHHSVWSAVSRAVRTPSRADHDLQVSLVNEQNTTVPAFDPVSGTWVMVPALVQVSGRGSRDFESEELVAYEIGYRAQPSARLSLDCSLFYNDYRKLRSQEPEDSVITVNPDASVTVEQVYFIDNKLEGESFGAEIFLRYQITDWWSLAGSFSWVKIQLHSKGSSTDPLGEDAEGETPQHQANLYSYINLPHGWELDSSLFYYDNSYKVPSYIRFDLRLGWRPSPHWEFSLKGENLLDDRHPEFITYLGVESSEVPRSWFANVKWHF